MGDYHSDLLHASAQKLQFSREFLNNQVRRDFGIRDVWPSNIYFFSSEFFRLFGRKLQFIGLLVKKAYFNSIFHQRHEIP